MERAGQHRKCVGCRWSDIQVNVVLEDLRGQRDAIINDSVVKLFPNMLKMINPQIQEAQQKLNKINTKKITQRFRLFG